MGYGKVITFQTKVWFQTCLIWIHFGDDGSALIWLGSPSRYFTSTYPTTIKLPMRANSIIYKTPKGPLGSGWYICDKKTLKNYWGSWFYDNPYKGIPVIIWMHQILIKNDSEGKIPSWTCQPVMAPGGLLNKDPIVRLTAQVWTLDLGFSDETYLLPSGK